MSAAWDPYSLDPFVTERAREHFEGTCRRCSDAKDWREPGRSLRLCGHHASESERPSSRSERCPDCGFVTADPNHPDKCAGIGARS